MFARFKRSTPRRIAVPAVAAICLSMTLAFVRGPDGPRGDYSFRTVDVPFGVPGEDLDMQILWMNDAGVITAQFQSPRSSEFAENMHTAVLQDCDWEVLEVPGAVTTGGTNANSLGQVVLSHHSGDDVWHASFHSRRGLAPFPDLRGYPGGIVVQGVNDLGQIAAVVGDADGAWHGLFGSAGRHSIVDFPGPDTEYTQPNMINNRGVGVGMYIAAGQYHAFKWKDGAMTNIDPPTSAGTEPSATSINNAGVIVGIWLNPEGEVTGYVQDGRDVAELAVPGSTYTLPYSINDRGQIAGVYGDADGIAHGFVATPRRGRHH